MLCPLDQAELVMTERQGVEIDYCPKCRGVWLDRGELDKILDRAAAEVPASNEPSSGGERGYAPSREYRDRDDGDHRHSHGYHRKRKKSFLNDILDF